MCCNHCTGPLLVLPSHNQWVAVQMSIGEFSPDTQTVIGDRLVITPESWRAVLLCRSAADCRVSCQTPPTFTFQTESFCHNATVTFSNHFPLPSPLYSAITLRKYQSSPFWQSFGEYYLRPNLKMTISLGTLTLLYKFSYYIISSSNIEWKNCKKH